jgi:hypothetical protein
MADARDADGQRLVLAFPPARVQQPAIDAAAQLAQLLSLQLLGLFIEDASLLAAASLPFAREFDASRRAWKPLSLERLEQDFVAVAEALRRSLARSAGKVGVHAEFAVFRGDRGAMLATRTAPGDIIAVFESVAARSSRRMGLAAGTLFVPPDAGPQRGPIVVIAESPRDPGIEVAARIAEPAGLELVVLDVVQETSKAFWLEEIAEDNSRRRLRAPSGVAARGAHFQPFGLPPARLVVLTAAALARFGDRLLALATGRREPWLVLEQPVRGRR